jgi:tRNA pseudouridine38-40 synthase
MKTANPDWRRICLTIAYDGASFEGWQSQRGGNTIQDKLDRAIGEICRDASGVQGSGRTDAGVHALAQVAHFDVPATLSMDAGAWQRALNSMLPGTIRIIDCCFARGDFHARFSATGKVYRYEWFTGPILSPLRLNRVWHVRRLLEEAFVRQAGDLFQGTHDFASFSANRREPQEAKSDTVRRIDRVQVFRQGEEWSAVFDGEGFLYKMVRMLVGAMVRAGQGGCTLDELRDRLENPSRTKKSPLAAPPDGLYLVQVRYGREPGVET